MLALSNGVGRVPMMRPGRNSFLSRSSLTTIVVALILSGCVAGPEANGNDPQDAYLLIADFPRMVIEVDHVEGARVSEFALTSLEDGMRNATGRTDVAVVRSDVLPRGDPSRVWNHTELFQLAAATLDEADPGSYARGGTAVIHVLYIYGSYENSEAWALGGSGTIFIFEGGAESGLPIQIPPASVPSPRGGPSVSDLTERSLLIHEAGHVIGLVSNGLEMVTPHNDPNDPAHSSNPLSVMRAGVDSFDAQRAAYLGGDPPPFEFDEDDIRDIRAYQEERGMPSRSRA